MPGWKNSNRRDQLPPDWRRIRSQVLSRDQGVCQHRDEDGSLCGIRATDVDHVTPGSDDSIQNLRSLCTGHHRTKSSSEGGRATALLRAEIKSRFRREERHPGDLS